MKRYFLFVLFLYFANIFCATSYVSSKSYFSVTPLFRPTMPEMVTVMHDKIEEEYPRNKIDVIFLGSVSGKECDIAKYFLPNKKTELVAAELGAQSAKDGTADIIANYFNVLTSTPLTTSSEDTINNLFSSYTFESRLKFKPKQKMFGAAFRYRRHLSEFTNKGYWVEFTIPFVYVKNDLGMTEEIIHSGGPNGNNPSVPTGFVGTMTAAFKQDTWRYGQINGAQKKKGIADIYARLGYDYVKEPTHHLATFFGIVIPTGDKPNGEFLFEPVVGNGGHLGIFFGASAGFRIWCKSNKSIYWRLDTNGSVLAENTQNRSFDLKNKPWSRYMWVYLNSTTTGTKAGINKFSEMVKVDPGASRDLNTAFVFDVDCLKVEFGYHFFAKEPEKVKLGVCWNNGIAIAAITQPTSGSNSEYIVSGKSRNNASINQYARVPNDMDANGNEIYKDLTDDDFDLESAAHPGTISNALYADFNYNFGSRKNKYVKAGGAYEFSSNNTSLTRWYAWFRFGVDF